MALRRMLRCASMAFPLSSFGMNRLTVRAKYLYDGEQKFFARGVSYGPFPPNSRDERYPEPERTDADFALMRSIGVNLVRTYVPPPPWMFELAARHELRLMVGMPWPFHMAFLDSSEMMADIRKTIGDGVRLMRQFADVIFAYSLGNEIRSDIVRWHGPRAVNRFLRELYDLGKQSDPDGLFTFSNYPSAEYLDLNFLDIVSFNVYLHREADYRRYLSHLLAMTCDRPLVLSETGMDTIREGEAHQADLLAWQARAAFELGLSGFIVFAFTDEWHTGGAAITDWAFGLVTRDREPKLAFKRIGEVFGGVLPPPLENPPKASVVVCAYNAAPTIGACLESLKQLNYPDYEVIVIDDGSTDATAQIAERAGARVRKIEHRGLSAARNAGIAAATGRIVAFLDADGEADRDWLYHLAETIVRKNAIAAGGQNFPPQVATAVAAAIAAAPGAPREVRSGDDELDQLCGCNMALDKSKLPQPAPFDEAFTTAGDDVDFSWALQERGFKLAYAPGAIVIHRRRATVGAYVRQQMGYGRGEAILARKYPNRVGPGGGVYGGGGWLSRWFGAGARVYYGAFGRGLFQSLYRGADFPAALQIPLNFSWVIVSLLLALVGMFGRTLILAAGIGGLTATLACAIGMAAMAPLGANDSRLAVRARLAILNLLGMITRSYARHSVYDRTLYRALRNDGASARARLQLHGRVPLAPTIVPDDPTVVDRLIDAMRHALLKRGVTVVVSDGYQPYDLRIETSAGVSAAINILSSRDNAPMAGWKLGVQLRQIRAIPALLFGFLIVDFCFGVGLGVAVAILMTVGAVALYILDARLISPLIEIAAEEACRELNNVQTGEAAA
jgi:glycosyltransferase involved in cell wall biosynthesis